MNWDRIEGNWKQVEGSVKQQWSKLTNDHLGQVDGSLDKLAGKIQEAYGVSKDEAIKQILAWQQTPAYRKMYDSLTHAGEKKPEAKAAEKPAKAKEASKT